MGEAKQVEAARARVNMTDWGLRFRVWVTERAMGKTMAAAALLVIRSVKLLVRIKMPMRIPVSPIRLKPLISALPTSSARPELPMALAIAECPRQRHFGHLCR
mgnify:CR=1 FL=1